MATIRSINFDKDDASRVSITMDDGACVKVSAIVAVGLRAGFALNDVQLAALLEKEAVERAYQSAITFLSYRPRSAEEVRRYLSRHKTQASAIAAALDRLRESDLVNDRAFATTWIENRSAFRPRGKRALQQELRLKGIPDSTVEQAVSSIDERALALAAAVKRARHYESLPLPEFKKKLSDFLLRRGFPYSVITEVVAAAWKTVKNTQPIEEEAS